MFIAMFTILCVSMVTDQLEEIRKITLAKVICTNADDIQEIQPRVMELPFREAYPDNM